ncbi:hypothetical protein FISHEDRAFT_64358 [Fistulina hepatica ATCC 64428]|uniref:DinB-like domain-containing protein n=1 Tax=Fistulina hepatica ATCC 64428 TaxID=1128425 RepID=A0A0D7AKR3_9AGAR|nr:hypothetical protein FISHEDRAFT_64358 [Fistulina hepatica ATCC 64428]
MGMSRACQCHVFEPSAIAFKYLLSPFHDDVMEQLAFVAKHLLLQAVDLVENHLQSDEQLTVEAQHIPGSTIGKHLRHARDHYTLLLDASTSPSQPFSYDIRVRNTAMESNRAAAIRALHETIQRFETIATDKETPLTLDAVTPSPQRFATNFGREFWFCSLHCIHHWAVVRVIAGELGIKLSDDFGFAPSTLVYQGSTSVLASSTSIG